MFTCRSNSRSKCCVTGCCRCSTIFAPRSDKAVGKFMFHTSTVRWSAWRRWILQLDLDRSLVAIVPVVLVLPLSLFDSRLVLTFRFVLSKDVFPVPPTPKTLVPEWPFLRLFDSCFCLESSASIECSSHVEFLVSTQDCSHLPRG